MRISPFAQFLFVPGQSVRGPIAPSVSRTSFENPIRIDPNADGNRSELSDRRGSQFAGPQFDFRRPQFAEQLLVEAQGIGVSPTSNDAIQINGVDGGIGDPTNDPAIVQITPRSNQIAVNRYADTQNLGRVGQSLALDIPSPSVNTVI